MRVSYALRVWLWIAGAVALQAVASLTLLALVTLLVAGAAIAIDRARFVRLLSRIRWLLLSIVILFGWMTPGTAIAPFAVALMPTYEGMELALLHALRLLALVAWLIFWFAWLPIPEQPTALYRAFFPLVWFGVPLERFAVRLALILDGLDALAKAPVRLRDWRHLPRWLEGEDNAAESCRQKAGLR
ncbi:hypothetical protein [Hydrogenophilus thiooxidans]|uniref:hypothetical protein n=1 Tax=Hydrogenophilus thiooxidans TaxID=2820326 RepID=UPI001C226AA3|nr:hypothetical protein [Hydrogenophilus thiooxidans]